MQMPSVATCRRPLRAALGALAVAAVMTGSTAGCGVDVTGTEADDGAAATVEGAASTLPAVELQQLDGSDALLANEIGGPAVINLWATWCPPCRIELPAFQAVHADLGDSVRFIGVNQSEDPVTARQFLDSVGITYDQMIDPDGDLLAALRVTGLPATVFLAADGTWILHSGVLTEDYLRELIAGELGVTA